mmetsp:Transcript_56128/g.115918  ORF Transcript_56128/g.115918 Transcript_56128/m.115918 type:complete len:86 (+) Transcript_56128:2183-2440(+)
MACFGDTPASSHTPADQLILLAQEHVALQPGWTSSRAALVKLGRLMARPLFAALKAQAYPLRWAMQGPKCLALIHYASNCQGLHK